ncbi:hypothetical protein RH915_02295 [Serpentinicella sp. ANB-PHB4]|uniref:hypothetical protein n=1 Tax=Serpentinicella sp. ANB-PHB4 TaxID=3074076 RepID=UPI00285FB07B|nr:hypothetical protein [Serpentinicella sp. ANB-PHB4]MDR5658313.1 hypothetical protein [Serpentinicella sp. ANB-PHB4]
MFRRRRGLSISRFIGTILLIVGTMLFIYIIPSQLWLFILASLLVGVGILFFNT